MSTGLKRDKEDVSWDELRGIVVIASSEDAARAHASAECCEEGPNPWMDQGQSSIEFIGTCPWESFTRTILMDVNQG